MKVFGVIILIITLGFVVFQSVTLVKQIIELCKKRKKDNTTNNTDKKN